MLAVSTFDRYSNGSWISLENESSSSITVINSSKSLLFRIAVPGTFSTLTSFQFRIFIANPHSAEIRWSLYGNNPGEVTGYVPGGFITSITAQPETTSTAVSFAANEFSTSLLSHDLSSSRIIYLLIQTFGSADISIDTSGRMGTSRSATAGGNEPTLTWSASNATTDGSIKLSVSDLPAWTTVYVKYGSTDITNSTWGEDKSLAEITFSASQLKQWFMRAGVTTLQSITITATVAGYPTVTASFTLTAGSNMKPTAGIPTVTIVQPERIQQTFPNTWIANISRAKIEATVSSGSNAAIRTVVVNYGSESVTMTLNSTTGKYEVTTSKPVTGNCTFTVVVTDERGMTARSTYDLTGVNSYTKPTVLIMKSGTYRCDSTKTEQDGGPYVCVKAKASVDTRISGNAINSLYFYIAEEGSSVTHELDNDIQSAAVQLQSPRHDSTITVVVVVEDKISEAVTAKIALNGAHRDVLIKRSLGKTIVGIGGAPNTLLGHNNNYVDGIDVAGTGGYYVNGVDILNLIGTNRTKFISQWENDFLAVDTSNPSSFINETKEFAITANQLSNWSNLPPGISSTFRGIRIVIVGVDYVLAIVIEVLPVSGRIWINRWYFKTGDQWSGWKGHTPDIT